MTDSSSGRGALEKLVEHFDQNLSALKSSSYNETQVRREFIDPLFTLLGWDVDNRQGYAEAYKDVIHEDAIKIGGYTKAPDYCFRIGGTRKFFVEAKKPAVNVKEDAEPAYQLRRYAWSAKLPLSVLTDFEEFAVYDCRLKPAHTDGPAMGRVQLLTYRDYLAKWEEISAVFSREAVLKGSFDKYVESNKAKRGTAEVDAAFLKEIEAWRDALARNIALRNGSLTTRELNFAVQATLDRIIFLRICEDRGVENYGRLMALQNGPDAYKRLMGLFREADERYNSGLFHFEQERGREEAPDALTPRLEIDDKVLKEILKALYYPESPYEFSVLPADILGQVYEQFLGKVIRLTAGHQAKVEDKPEVKKAGGVYYTPTYIVDYIVKNTVGKMVEGKTPREVAGESRRGGALSPPARANAPGGHGGPPLRILDPACGSGSFLLGAYQYLLTWYRDWYVNDGAAKWSRGKEPRLYQAQGGEWKLTTAERKKILLDHIYGVDIDSQAVEVTKLSLLLKVLEGETSETISAQLKLFKERALPDLSHNIKCGNSLIGSDFYKGQQVGLFGDDERERINAFDWEDEFPEVFGMEGSRVQGSGFREKKKSTATRNPNPSTLAPTPSNGFDVVIGNPPYGFHQIHSDHSKRYFRNTYVSSRGSFEHYFLFYERSLKLLRRDGMHGFIVPVTWLTIPSAHSLREFVLSGFALQSICWLPKLVFKKAQVNTLVSIIARSLPSTVNILVYDCLGFARPPARKTAIRQSECVESNFQIAIFEERGDKRIVDKMLEFSRPLGEYARPCSGYNPYEVGKGVAPGGGPQTEATVKEKPYHSDRKIGKEWKPEIVGRDLRRFFVDASGRRWIRYGPWLAAPREPANFIGKRILIQEITGGQERRIVAAFFDGELYHSRDVIPVKVESAPVDALFLLGVINSRLMTWYHHKKNPKAQKELFPKVLVGDVREFPIPSISLSDEIDKLHHDQMVSLVDQMLSLHKQLHGAKTPHEKESLQRQIAATDKEIDQLVYQLYGLTEDEIRIVESAS